MQKLITKTLLGKLLLITVFMLPFLIILEVLVTVYAVFYFTLALIAGSIYCWDLKGGVAVAGYCSVVTVGLLSLISWPLPGISPVIMISLYLLTGIAGGKVAASCLRYMHCFFRALYRHKIRLFSQHSGKHIDYTFKEIRQAKIELDLARQNFEYAEADTVDAAIIKLNNASTKFDQLTAVLKHNRERYALTIKINVFPRS